MAMYNNHIIFRDFNNHLISRLHSRAIFDDFIGSIDKSKQVELDFEGVRIVTLSFATELFSNLKKTSIESKVLNANSFVNETLCFALYSTEKLELQS
jgi:hypothetical protein